ncbi:hypothetical protein [Paenibacillus luteus]|uniref:hypothetical protein n=1 Tax=Paenibacillus luteus TaxID=2545753 RepID=UPI0011442CDD|nr:hypothetical protein [Paenibacillus luteus]
MKMRISKVFLSLTLVFMLIPAFAASVFASAPSTPVISYNAYYHSVSFNWTSSNAVNFDIYKDGNYVTTTSSRNYTVSVIPSSAVWFKVVARSSDGQTAESTVVVSTPSVNDSWTFSGLYGNIRMGATLTNPRSDYGTTMYITLYRVTSSGEVSVGTTSVYVGAGQTVTSWYPLATGQPYGTYRVAVSSPWIIASGVSLGTYF